MKLCIYPIDIEEGLLYECMDIENMNRILFSSSRRKALEIRWAKAWAVSVFSFFSTRSDVPIGKNGIIIRTFVGSIFYQIKDCIIVFKRKVSSAREKSPMYVTSWCSISSFTEGNSRFGVKSRNLQKFAFHLRIVWGFSGQADLPYTQIEDVR